MGWGVTWYTESRLGTRETRSQTSVYGGTLLSLSPPWNDPRGVSPCSICEVITVKTGPPTIDRSVTCLSVNGDPSLLIIPHNPSDLNDFKKPF